MPFLAAGVPAVDIIDLDNYQAHGKWHTAADTLDAVSARSLQVVGDVVLAALPHIEAKLTRIVLTGHRVVRPQPYKIMKARYRIPRKQKSHRHHALSIATVAAAH